MTRCGCCGSDFSPLNTRLRQGKMYTESKCKLCLREDYRMRYERDRLDERAYKRRLAYNRAWHERNKREFAAYRKKWERVNADRIRARKKEYYLKNRDKILKRNAEWKIKNRNPKFKDNSVHVWRILNQGIKKQ
jgi:hypothetical protein